MLTIRICKKIVCFCLIIFAFVFCKGLAGVCTEIGTSNEPDYNTVGAAIVPQQVEQEADNLFYKGIYSKSKKMKETYLAGALTKYMLLLNIQPDNVIFCTQIAVIHDVCGRKSLAKSYFFRAINLENLNPFANYYFGEYYLNMKDYRNALKHYAIAFKNGYGSYYEVNNRLALVYEKLGDLQKAKEHYTISLVVNPNQQEINQKIIMLDKAYYSKKAYESRTNGE